MKEFTSTLKVDSLGRVMIPKAIRDALGIMPGSLVRVTLGKEDIAELGEQGKNADALSLPA
jgi:AbrB family looped-hinge helix DNA binding protein